MRFLAIEDGPAGVVQRETGAVGTRLGAGLADRGTLDPAGAERTLAAVATFGRRARELGAALDCIATSAMRRADDGAAFSARVETALGGVPVRILSGEAEAAASFRGATYGRANDARLAVVDVGGGSVEVAVGRAGALEAARSLEIGSVRVTERHPALAGGMPGPRARAAAVAARAEIAETVAPFAALGPVSEAIAVAGTPLTLAAIARGSSVTEVSGERLALAAIDDAIDRLLGLDLDRRRAVPGMLAQRADVLVGGALVLAETLRALGAAGAVAEANDLLLGVLLEPVHSDAPRTMGRDRAPRNPPDGMMVE